MDRQVWYLQVRIAPTWHTYYLIGSAGIPDCSNARDFQLRLEHEESQAKLRRAMQQLLEAEHVNETPHECRTWRLRSLSHSIVCLIEVHSLDILEDAGNKRGLGLT